MGAAPEPPPRTAEDLPRTAGEMARRAREFLARKGIEEARLESELLVAHALGLSRLGLFLALDRPVDEREVAAARALLVRRGRREPTAYLVGAREFYGRPFAVGPDVLIPRPETELVVDLAREHARALGRAPRVFDAGTGSGCLAATIALEVEGAEVCAADLSPRAVERARANAAALGATVDVREGDAFAALAELGRERPFDLVVSNPPYVEPDERAGLAPEVRDHEPALALYAPEGDPDHWVRRLCEEAAPRLARGGALIVELGHRQGARAAVLARERGWDPRLVRDLAGIERVLLATRG